MKIEYELSNEDFITYHLFTSSQSKSIKKRRRLFWLLNPGLFLLIGVLFFFIYKSEFYAICFTVISILWLIAYPFYSRWRYRKYFRKFVKENYAHRIGRVGQLSLEEDKLCYSDDSNEGKLNLTEICALYEISGYFYIKLFSNVSYVLPKDKIEEGDLEDFISELEKKTNLKRISLLEWKWR